MRVVYKYPLEPEGEWNQCMIHCSGSLPIIRLFGEDPITHLPTLWIEHDLDDHGRWVTVFLIATGQDTSEPPLDVPIQHVGSHVFTNGLVWHCYEEV